MRTVFIGGKRHGQRIEAKECPRHLTVIEVDPATNREAATFTEVVYRLSRFAFHPDRIVYAYVHPEVSNGNAEWLLIDLILDAWEVAP